MPFFIPKFVLWNAIWGQSVLTKKSTFLYYIFWYIVFGSPQMAYTVTFLTIFTNLVHFQVDFQWSVVSKMNICYHRGH